MAGGSPATSPARSRAAPGPTGGSEGKASSRHVLPAPAGLGRRVAVEAGAHAQAEQRTDLPHGLRAERIPPKPDDPSLALLETQHLLERLAAATGREPKGHG